MMKNLICLVLSGLSAAFAVAQEFPEFGVIKTDERSLTECSFDKEADAVILVHEAYADHDERYQLITYHRVRLKILKEKGIGHANIKIPFYSNDHYESIGLVRGRIFNDNGTGGLAFSDLEKKSIFTKNINKYWSEVVFTFPGVKVGSIIEYTYQSIMHSYGGLDDWQFQEELPVARSKYSLVILPNYEFAYKVQKSEDYPIKITPDRSAGRVVFEMNDLPGLTEEPYMDARKDYVQRVIFQLSGGSNGRKFMASWPDMIRELLQDANFGNQLGKNLAGTDEFIRETKLDPSKTSRLLKVYNYVRANVGWNGFTGIYSSEGLKSAWLKKTGHSGEMNMILTSLLRDVEIDASPLLVSERSHGRVNPQYPFMDQFNHVFVYALIDGKKYYIDVLDKNNPVHIIPYSILNTTALIVNRKAGGLVEIKDENFEYRDYISVSGKLSPDGKIDGDVFLSSADYARTKRLASYQENSAAYISQFTNASTVDVDSFKLINEDIDTLPLQQRFRFSSAVNSTGDYTMLPVTMFTEFNGNPFLNKMRFSDVNFGYRQSISMNYAIEIPQNLQIEALPKAIRVSNADKSISFQRSVSYDEKSRKLIARVSVAMNKSQYGVEEYPALQEFYKKMYDLLEEQIVLKKS